VPRRLQLAAHTSASEVAVTSAEHELLVNGQVTANAAAGAKLLQLAASPEVARCIQ